VSLPTEPAIEPAGWWGIADDGSVIEVRVPVTSSSELYDRWPPLGLQRRDEGVRTVVRRISLQFAHGGGEPTAFVDGLASPGGWERIESELALFATERLSGLVAIHGALVLEPRSRRALLVPGPSRVGKSSLCVAAAAAGAVVLSDEFALVDPATGLVTGWHRPVRVRRGDGGVERIDLAQACEPVPVGLVALVQFGEGGDAWAPIGPAEAVVGLLANTVCARSRPDESLDAALAIARSAPAVAGMRGDADRAITALLELVANASEQCHD
jgi:hypothetical protein